MSPNELSALTPIAKALNDRSNEINETIALVNRRLAELNVGFEIWLGPWEKDIDPYLIGFTKVGDKWELATRTCKATTQIDYSGLSEYVAVVGSYGPAKPVLQAPRAIRIETLDLLPDLMKALKKTMEETINVIDRAKTIASEL